MDLFRLAEIDSEHCEHTKKRVTLETLPIQRTGVPAHPDLQSAFARMNYLVVRDVTRRRLWTEQSLEENPPALADTHNCGC